MSTPILLLGPAASGKTQTCIERLRTLLAERPLAPAWVVLPDRHQASTFRRRLAEAGGALGAQVGTFGDVYQELLAQANASIPVAPEPVLHRLVQSALDTLADLGQLAHYFAIRRRPGLMLALTDLFAELKRARISPEQFQQAVSGQARLQELGRLYERYQSILLRFDWADPEGLGWLAILALEQHSRLAAAWHVWVDGFDSFTPTQLDTLALVAERADSLTVTLMGEPGMSRLAHRRFKHTLEQLENRLAFGIATLPRSPTRPPALAQLETAVFVSPITPLTAGPELQFIEAQTPALEAREALRWLKARIMRGQVPIRGCAIIARDLTLYRPFLREVAREFGLPIHLVSGEPLETNPAIAALLRLLELTLNRWARRPLLDVLRTPYFELSAYGLTRVDAARLEAVARWGQVLEGLAQWQDALARLASQSSQALVSDEGDDSQPPDLPRGLAAERLWQSLERLVRRFTPPARATLRDWVKWVEEALADDGGAGLNAGMRAQADTIDRDEAALDAFRDILRALVLSTDILAEQQSMRYEEFYTLLRGAVAAGVYLPETSRQPEAIYAANLNAARGVSYPAVAVLGLSEGLFPAPLEEDPFLSDDERQQLSDAGLRLEKRLRSDQQSLFYEAVTRASKYLLLTRPCLAEDGEAWEPSPYWKAARDLFTEARLETVRLEQHRSLAEAASLPEVLALLNEEAALPDAFKSLAPFQARLRRAGQILAARLAPEAQGPYEGQLSALAVRLVERYGPAHTWSASRLETYGSCGFRFYIAYALKLEPRQRPEAGYDAAQLGMMFHKILEQVFQAADPLDVDALVAALPEVANPILDVAPQQLGFRPTALWPTERAALLSALEGTLHQLVAEANGFRPVQFEVKFEAFVLETPVGPVRLRGLIDRVDQNAAGDLRVIDYKTGASHLDKGALVRGERLQLPLYAAAVEQALQLGSVVDGFYWAVQKAEAGSLSLAEFEHTTAEGKRLVGVSGALTMATAHIHESVRDIRAGQFQPQPPDGGCPDYCPATAFCWRYKPGW